MRENFRIYLLILTNKQILPRFYLLFWPISPCRLPCNLKIYKIKKTTWSRLLVVDRGFEPLCPAWEAGILALRWIDQFVLSFGLFPFDTANIQPFFYSANFFAKKMHFFVFFFIFPMFWPLFCLFLLSIPWIVTLSCSKNNYAEELVFSSA